MSILSATIICAIQPTTWVRFYIISTLICLQLSKCIFIAGVIPLSEYQVVKVSPGGSFAPLRSLCLLQSPTRFLDHHHLGRKKGAIGAKGSEGGKGGHCRVKGAKGDKAE